MADYSFGTLTHSDTSYDPTHPWIGKAQTGSGQTDSYATVTLTLNKRCVITKLAFKGWSVSGQQKTYRLTLNNSTYASATKPTSTGSVQGLTFTPGVTLAAGAYTIKVETTDSNVGYMGMQYGVFQVDTANCDITAAAPSVHVKVGGNWKQCDAVYVKVNGTWVEAKSVHIKDGTWKEADG